MGGGGVEGFWSGRGSHSSWIEFKRVLPLVGQKFLYRAVYMQSGIFALMCSFSKPPTTSSLLMLSSAMTHPVFLTIWQRCQMLLSFNKDALRIQIWIWRCLIGVASITEVKQRRVRFIIGWVTAWDCQVPYTLGHRAAMSCRGAQSTGNWDVSMRWQSLPCLFLYWGKETFKSTSF